ncbi:AMP-binding protein [Clostridium ljungdahlii]|uniref:Putative acyl--CoA ligase YhfT n=1 Tax=Clostridium ljungdahlii TaxID=1538 RepID=A0A170NJ05_9CLOT|nr:AMP-binding protein [Clostridium ljungdahlii]OAA90204.1 putative acyl--CoA ligase YhfT [Clostridium ljungdahlii]
MLIFSGVFKNAEKKPQKICMTFGKKVITYKELAKSINERAAFLASKYRIGSRIIIKNLDPIDAITVFLACSRAGLISITVNDKITSLQLNKVTQKVKQCCIIDDKFYFRSDGKEYYKLPCIDDSCIFLGALSSGTTGHNKVIWRDHKSWASAFKYQSEIFNISSSDILFLIGSLSYTGNLNSAIHILNEGGSIVFSKSIYPKTWIREMIQNNVTSMFAVPARYRVLLKELDMDFENVNSILSAGDKLDGETIDLLKKKFPNAHIFEYYGASELGHVSYIDFRNNYNIESVGKAFPQVKFWLKDDLVWVESPYIAPDFRPRASVGDIGKIDEKGNLYILGRKNNTINKGGVKILPYNIEKVLDANPKILKSAVFGIKDPVKGEDICVTIVLKVDTLGIEDIRKYCKKNLEPYLWPKEIKIVKDLKLNSSGKIDKKALSYKKK